MTKTHTLPYSKLDSDEVLEDEEYSGTAFRLRLRLRERDRVRGLETGPLLDRTGPSVSSSQDERSRPLSQPGELVTAGRSCSNFLYSWIDSFSDHNWQRRDMSSCRRPTISLRSRASCESREEFFLRRLVAAGLWWHCPGDSAPPGLVWPLPAQLLGWLRLRSSWIIALIA